MSSTTTQLVPAGTYAADPAHSRVGFAVKHLGIATVRGTFDRFDGTLVVGDDPAAASFTATIDAASVDTAEEQRDAHLRSADFFDVERFPTVTFASTRDHAGRRGDAEDRRRPHDARRHAPGGAAGVVQGGRRPIRGATSASASRPPASSRRGEFGMTFNQALGSGNVLVVGQGQAEPRRLGGPPGGLS